MKFGIQCSYDQIIREEIVTKLKQEGVNLIEIDKIPKEVSPKELNYLKDKFEYSIHATFQDMRPRFFPKPSYPKSVLNTIEKEIEIALALNARELILHGGSFFKGYVSLTKFLKKNIGLNYFLNLFAKTFGPLLKKANDSGIKVLIENSYPCFLLGRPYDIKYLKQKLPFLGFCFDLAHSEIYNQTQDLMNLNLDIEYIHLTDNNKKADQHLKIGEGSIDSKSFFKKLKNRNYNGKIIFECSKLQDSLDSLKQLRTF